MLMLDSPFVIKLYSTFQDDQFCFFLMELGIGGPLSNLLKYGALNEGQARFYAACMILALEHMHGRGIIYRDLKPENTLIDGQGYLKLTDYGLGKVIGDTRTSTGCGTPDYFPPEMIRGCEYSFECDWWSMGVSLYELLHGMTPFGSDGYRLYERILKADFEPFECSKEGKAIIKKGFCKLSVKKRLGVRPGGITAIQEHPWFAAFDFDWASLRARTMEAPWIPTEIAQSNDSENSSIFEDYDGENDVGIWREF